MMMLIYFSAVNKSRLKFVLYLHLALVFFMVARLSTYLYVLFGFRPPSFLQRLKLPLARNWEYAYLFSILPTIFAFFSLPRNRSFVMKQFLLGTFIFAILPIFYGVFDIFEELMLYVNKKEAKIMVQGFPLVLVWALYLAIAFQLHLFGFYFGKQLLNAWQSRGEKKRK